MNTQVSPPPDALLFITTHCTYCPSVLQALGELVKQGRIGRLEVVNIVARADLAAQYGVRSVPWIQLGELELEGMHSRAELEFWVERARTEQGLTDYYGQLLKDGQLPKAIHVVRRHPQHLAALLSLARDPHVELGVRIGVSAVVEDFAGTEVLQQQLPELIEMSRHADPRVRADACHFLALSESPDALEALESLSQDGERSVQEVANDSLAELREVLNV